MQQQACKGNFQRLAVGAADGELPLSADAGIFFQSSNIIQVHQITVMAADKIVRQITGYGIQFSIEIQLFPVFQGKDDLSPVAGKGDYFFRGDFQDAGFLFQCKLLLPAFSKFRQRLLQDAQDPGFLIWF